MKLKIKDYDFGHDIRYIMFIYDHPNCSQDDLVNMFCQSKGNVAKILKKFEDEGYIKREVNPENRRKYMLKTTSKANELVNDLMDCLEKIDELQLFRGVSLDLMTK